MSTAFNTAIEIKAQTSHQIPFAFSLQPGEIMKSTSTEAGNSHKYCSLQSNKVVFINSYAK